MATIKAANGQYVQRVGDHLRATGTDPKADAAQVTVEPQPDGKIALKQGGSYWSAQQNGDLQCNRPSPGPWESFEKVPGERAGSIAIRSTQWGMVVSARLDLAGNPLQCVTGDVHDWESFNLGGSGTRPLHVDGLNLRTPNGRRWVMKGLSHFPLLLRDLLGTDIEPLLTQFDDVLPGVEITHRVFSTMGDFPPRIGAAALIPENYPAYWDRLASLPGRLAAHGHRLLLTVFADVQMFGWSLDRQRAHLAQVVSVLQGNDNMICSLVNQAKKNGVDPGQFSHPGGGFLWSRDSGMEADNPYLPAWDWCEYTSTRKRPEFRFSGGDLWYVVNGWGNAQWGGTHKPSALLEPIGVNEADNGGSRINDTEAYFALGTSAATFGLGAVAHPQNGATGELLGPIQKQACVRMWQGAMAVEAVT
jgi:hypothetical protein